MLYPVWELEFGAPLLIAVISILHVYISHFAIGGGLYLVVSERLAYKRNDTVLLDFLKKHSRFFVLITLVLGAITGVGIWFTIGLFSPGGTGSLIRIFVWAWGIEWVFFTVEIAAAIIYYFTWDRISRKTHLKIGWIYFTSAFLSLAVINGILSFMLTPGQWIENGNIWSAFFNPGYFPSLMVRTALCISLAGIYALLTSTFIRDKNSRKRITRYSGFWILAGALLSIPSVYLYLPTFPILLEEFIAGSVPTAVSAYQVIFWASIIFMILSLIPVLLPKYVNLGIAGLVLVYGIIVFGSGEWLRETARKPYIIYDHTYGNGLALHDYDMITANGGLIISSFYVGDEGRSQGEDVFRTACRSCHTIDGYRGLKKPLEGLDNEFIHGLMEKLENIKGKMPPFPGNTDERNELANYLSGLYSEKKNLNSGSIVFTKRCGFCHTKNNYRGLYDFFYGQYSEDILEILPLLSDMIDKMPDWTGTDDEAGLLADFMEEWYNEGNR